jgi:DnaJ domain
MAGPVFYQILGVSRTASAEEIKSAHRELVKKYHPDLFRSGTQKARANKKLQEINEAYAVLSNPERRRQYDAIFSQKVRIVTPQAPPNRSRSRETFRRSPATTIWQNLAGQANATLVQVTQAYRSFLKTAIIYSSDLWRTARAVTRRGLASQSAAALRHSDSWGATAWNFARRWTRWLSVKMTASILGIMILILIMQALGKEPEITTAWALWENTVVDPPGNDPGVKPSERNWLPLGYHHTKAQCAESLKQRVAADEKGGSKVFLDERTGTIALTIYAKTEAALTEEFLREKLRRGDPSDGPPESLEQQARAEAQEFIRKNGLVQQVKQYQCRETQLIGSESWLRSKLRQLGLVS